MMEKDGSLNEPTVEPETRGDIATEPVNDRPDLAGPTENAGPATAEPAADDETAKLAGDLAEKTRQLAETTDRLKRLQADFDNFRRRTRNEKEELSAIVTQGIIADLLPVLDNFERALTSGANQDSAALFAGVEMIYRQFRQTLAKTGLATIDAVGEVFDPQRHEAVMRIADDNLPDGTVAEELQKGYLVGDKVIRPSMVKVINNS